MAFSLKNKVRIVTAASLFDGHDAAINIMRRILQSKGAEIIHLGHNRSVAEIVECAIEEDVQGIAITSYQGGHVEFFKYMKDLLDQNGCGHIKIFGGGGGTILPEEIRELHQHGITRIYSPDDGRTMGLEGMIEDVLMQCDFELNGNANTDQPLNLGEVKEIRAVARKITLVENGIADGASEIAVLDSVSIPVLGITGTGGAGKSSVTDEIVRRYLNNYTDKTIAVISVDPSKKKTGGALLGDRIRMNAISHNRAYMRSLATRDDNTALSAHVQEAINICKLAGFDMVILESAGVGQSDASILDFCDVSLYIMTPEYGAASQLEKINMLDFADIICINKFDKAGALDALHDVRKQYKRNHELWNEADENLPVVGTIAAQFNDAGINQLFDKIMFTIQEKMGIHFSSVNAIQAGLIETTTRAQIIPPKRVRYLAEIADANRSYNEWTNEQCILASKWYQLNGAIQTLPANSVAKQELENIAASLESSLHQDCKKMIQQWPELVKKYQADFFEYSVRNKTIRQPLTTQSLSGTRISKVILPRYKDWGDILRWQLQENIPGEFPYTAGVFELKRQGEDPTRMFAGEGSSPS
jgi:methylmalonyl-CoA mutase